MAMTGERCAKCGRSLRKGKYDKGGKSYCGQGCAEGSGCTCS
jgi:hypothetical protein